MAVNKSTFIKRIAVHAAVTLFFAILCLVALVLSWKALGLSTCMCELDGAAGLKGYSPAVLTTLVYSIFAVSIGFFIRGIVKEIRKK
jgi:hypothetical protein